MPGLSVVDGTPRDCASPACGSEGDTSIIRERELGIKRASALGRTNANGPVDAAAAIATFMGNPGNSTAAKRLKRAPKGSLLSDLLGGNRGNNKNDDNGGGDDDDDGAAIADGSKTHGTVETGVKAAAGTDATSGLPTCSDDGTISVTYHQVNQDGAGPLTAMIDPTSGGTDPSAFQKPKVIQDVPGIGVAGHSSAKITDFPVKVQMPEGMTCTGTAGEASNVCILRVNNKALAGPFCGSAAFTQSPAAQKRTLEYRMRRRHSARGIVRGSSE